MAEKGFGIIWPTTKKMSERLKRVFLVRDCSANWFEHVPGCLEDGAWRFYAKHPGWFATDLEGMVDWCVADRIDALAVEGFLSDRHGLYRLAWVDVRRSRD